MIGIIGGIVLIITAVVVWVGKIQIDHALAIFMGIVGLLILLYGVAPQYWSYGRRGRGQV